MCSHFGTSRRARRLLWSSASSSRRSSRPSRHASTLASSCSLTPALPSSPCAAPAAPRLPSDARCIYRGCGIAWEGGARMLANDLKRRGVLALSNAEKIGQVEDVLFDAQYRQVLGFRVK